MREYFEKHKNLIRRGVVYFGILLLTYIFFMHFFITSDYVPAASLGGQVEIPDIKEALPGGRFLSYLLMWIYYFLSKIHISHYENTYVIQLIGMSLYAYAGVILHMMFSKYFKDTKYRLFLDGAILLCFINPFMVETYVYGAFDWAFGILLAVLAAQKMVEKKYVAGFLWAFCATSVYQTNVFIMLIVCLLAVFLENYEKDLKVVVKRTLLVTVIAGAVAITSIVLQKVVVFTGNNLASGREANISGNVIERIWAMLSAAKSILISMHGMLPRSGLFIFVIVLYLSTMFVLVIKRKKIGASIIWTGLTGVWFVIPFCYGIVAGTGYAPRTILSLFFSISAFVIGSLYILKDYSKLIQTISVWCVGFALIVFFYMETCIMDCYIQQALDYNEAMCIQAEIKEYEKETGIEVDTIVAGKSPEPIYYSSTLHLSYGVTYNYRIMHDFWAQTRFINYVNGETYEVAWMDETEYEEYFGTQSWDVFNPSEQLHFEGDTLYWAIY